MIVGLLGNIGISSADTRSSAKRKKKHNRDLFVCVECMKGFDKKRQLRRHVKKGHFADKEAIKAEFDELREQKWAATEPWTPADDFNYTMALAKVTLLEEIF